MISIEPGPYRVKSLDPAIVEFVRDAVACERYAAYLRDTLMELVAVNTAAVGRLDEIAAREKAFFDLIEREVKNALGADVVLERPPINSAIARDPDYSLPSYAADASGRVPDVDRIYADRTNLIAIVAGSGSPGLILHAHVDVVPPWFGPRVEGQRVYGRGACDNKVQVAVLLAQMKLLREIEEKFGTKPSLGRVYQFVIDEEIGGNGSLSAALDPRFTGVPVLMHESTDLVPYCAHRGAVYYRCKLSVGKNADMTAVELFPFVVLALESEGRKFKRETQYPGFTAEHVQTNHGVLGCYGEHAGNVCDHVAIELVARTNVNPERMALRLIQFFEEAAAEYVNRYGPPKVERHFDVKVLPSTDTQNFRIDVWGKSGHMGAVAACDNAITKAALLFAGLLKVSGKYPGIQAWGRFADSPASDTNQTIVLEGGQGFTPSHTLSDVKARMSAAVTDAVKKYCKLRGRRFDASMVEMTFDRLHNDAYADSPEIAPMQALRAACSAVGHAVPEPIAWETSCDARIYHHKGHPVAIFGAGKLHLAHSDKEHVDMPDVQKTLAISTLATWAIISQDTHA